MTDTARDYQTLTTADTNGLDDLFDELINPDQALPSPNPDPIQIDPIEQAKIDPGQEGIALDQAAIALNLHIDTVRRYLKTGKLKGFKAKNKFGNKWFVSKEEMPPTPSQIQIDLPVSTPDIAEVIQIDPVQAKDDQAPADPPDPSLPTQDSLRLLAITETQSRVIENQSNQLKAAGDVIMYLRSQLDDKDNTIKLLTHSQHKRGWWAKFSSWFFKGQ
jgi:hypothetical protein